MNASSFKGPVSLTGQREDQHPITVLRDTARAQSLILTSVLFFGEEIACKANAVVRGTEMGFVPAPLHVESGLVTSFFLVAVRYHFPVDGVHFIMGNDIAGGRVDPVSEVVNAQAHAQGKCSVRCFLFIYV